MVSKVITAGPPLSGSIGAHSNLNCERPQRVRGLLLLSNCRMRADRVSPPRPPAAKGRPPSRAAIFLSNSSLAMVTSPSLAFRRSSSSSRPSRSRSRSRSRPSSPPVPLSSTRSGASLQRRRAGARQASAAVVGFARHANCSPTTRGRRSRRGPLAPDSAARSRRVAARIVRNAAVGGGPTSTIRSRDSSAPGNLDGSIRGQDPGNSRQIARAPSTGSRCLAAEPVSRNPSKAAKGSPLRPARSHLSTSSHAKKRIAGSKRGNCLQRPARMRLAPTPCGALQRAGSHLPRRGSLPQRPDRATRPAAREPRFANPWAVRLAAEAAAKEPVHPSRPAGAPRRVGGRRRLGTPPPPGLKPVEAGIKVGGTGLIRT